MPPVAMPTVIHIGTRNVFKQGQQYVYRWEPTHSIFMCDKTTAAGLPGENLVIVIEDSATGKWYVAVEGALTDAGFVSRRAAFRTQEEFWSADWHDWQVNRNNGGGEPDWDTRDHSQLSAETRVPPGTITVALNAGLQQLALTD
jgi:hypothetical protein